MKTMYHYTQLLRTKLSPCLFTLQLL